MGFRLPVSRNNLTRCTKSLTFLAKQVFWSSITADAFPTLSPPFRVADSLSDPFHLEASSSFFQPLAVSERIDDDFFE
jgi:hypothetical protein